MGLEDGSDGLEMLQREGHCGVEVAESLESSHTTVM